MTSHEERAEARQRGATAAAGDRSAGPRRPGAAGGGSRGRGVTRAVDGDRAGDWSVEGPDRRFMHAQKHVWNALCDHYFRVEIGGWHRLPEEPSLLVGNHSGGSLTMDAWTFVAEWWRRFVDRRVLHGTA